MTRMLLRRDDVIVGVDTHKNEHAAVVLDGLGGKLAELTVAPTVEGFRQLLAAATGHVGPDGRLVAFGVEGTGSYGIGLARFLAGGKLATPKTADGSIESLRLLKIACDTAVKARTAAMIALKAVLVTAADELRAELESLTDHKLIQACAGLDSGADLAAPEREAAQVLALHVHARSAVEWRQWRGPDPEPQRDVGRRAQRAHVRSPISQRSVKATALAIAAVIDASSSASGSGASRPPSRTGPVVDRARA